MLTGLVFAACLALGTLGAGWAQRFTPHSSDFSPPPICVTDPSGPFNPCAVLDTSQVTRP